MSKVSWFLMSNEELVKVYHSNNNLFRRQKSYYKLTGNTKMYDRMLAVEATIKYILSIPSSPTNS